MSNAIDTQYSAAVLRLALQDFADEGVRHDLNPTRSSRDVELFYLAYLRSIDSSVRERARKALEATDVGQAIAEELQLLRKLADTAMDDVVGERVFCVLREYRDWQVAQGVTVGVQRGEHVDHGRGDDSGPFDPDCPCRGSEKEPACALAGCGFCNATVRASNARPGCCTPHLCGTCGPDCGGRSASMVSQGGDLHVCGADVNDQCPNCSRPGEEVTKP